MVSKETSLEERTWAYIQSEGLINSLSDRILLTVSGGVDSIVMAEVMKNLGFETGIAHCNFKLRGEASDADEKMVAAWASYHKIPFNRKVFNPKAYASEHEISLQMAARELRYQWFEELCRQYGYQWIATAHNRDDVVETVLMNLTKGTGIKGLQGILPQKGVAIRPLLFANKAEITHYAETHHIKWREDTSNQSNEYQRNYLRHTVIPALRELNPSIEATLFENVQHFRDVNKVWEDSYNSAWENSTVQKGLLRYIAIPKLETLSPLRLYLHAFLHPYGFNASQIKQIHDSIQHQSGKMFYSSEYQLEISRQFLILAPKYIPQEAYDINHVSGRHSVAGYDFEMAIKEKPEQITFNQTGMVCLDWEKLTWPLQFRYWQDGDYFYPLGMQQPKKLSDFFVDEQLARLEKKQVPLLVNGNGEISWVVNYQIDERFKVTDDTRQIVTIERKP